MSTRLLAIAVCIVLLSMTPHSRSEAGDAPATQRADAANDSARFALHAYALKGEYEAGAPVDIFLLLTSTSEQLWRVMDEEADMDFSVTVKNANGDAATPTRYHQDHLAARKISGMYSKHDRALARGRELSYVLRVNRLVDMTTAGRYWIRVQRDIASRPGTPVIVSSNEVVVEVVHPHLRGGRKGDIHLWGEKR